MSWTTQLETAIRDLRDTHVEGVSVEADGEEIREIHILSSSTRPAKLIVRDVQALLRTRFNRSVDHRVVSVAFVAAARTNGTRHAPAADGDGANGRPKAAAAAWPSMVAPLAPDDGRIRYGSVNLYVAGTRAQAEVELRWKGIQRMGSASGWSTRDGAHRLVAQATLAAVQQYLSDDVALGIDDVNLLHVGRKDVVVVALTLLAHRQEKFLVGCCTVEQDAQQAVVLATLSGLNRVVGGLKTRDVVEYVLRPAPSRGA